MYTIVNGNNSPNVLSFVGVSGLYNQTLVNPYTGFTVTINEVKNINNAIYDGRGGTDTLAMSINGDVLTLVDAFGTIMITSVEIINAGQGGDVLNFAHGTVTYGNVIMRGATGDDILWGNIGNDTLNGSDGNDNLIGGAGDDFLFGGNNNDYLDGFTGTDYMAAGAGDDTFQYTADATWGSGFVLSTLGSMAGFASLVALDGKNRSFDSFQGDTDDFGVVGATGYDIITMTSGHDVLILSDVLSPILGSAPVRVSNIDQFDGGAGDDVIDLSGGAHIGATLNGGTGNDALAGSGGNDTLNGGDDNDYLSGGLGGDILAGGSGNDSYFYNLGDGSDIINETSGTDTIVMGSGITFSMLTLTVSGSDLIVGIGADTLTIQNHYALDLSGRVESVLFSNGDTFDIGSYMPNSDPVAVDDIFDGNEDEEITGNVLDNDTDADLDTLSVNPQSITTANGGTVNLLANGTFTYLAAANFNGVDSFDYTAFDGEGGTSTGTVTLNVASVNDAPVAVNDAFSGFRGETLFGDLLIDNGLGADSDIDGGTLAVVAQSFITANGGTVTINSDGTFSYLSAFDYFGEDSFEYTVLDGQGGMASGTANISVALDPSNTIIGSELGELIDGTGNADDIFGLGGDDTIRGQNGDDRIFGNEGNDTLYGDDGVLTGLILDKAFEDSVIFPSLKESVNIANLRPTGVPALGVNEDNLKVDFDTTANITFRKGFAGYNNSLGSYAIAEDGTIMNASLHWKNVKTAGVNTTHTIDLPVGEEGGQFGFFIISNGDRVNSGYQGLNVGGQGNIKFIYNYGQVDARAAKITDTGTKISIVYEDGAITRVLRGDAFFTTTRGDSVALNKDGKNHVASGLLDANNLSLDPVRADLATRPASLTKNGIKVDALNGAVLVASGNKIGVKQGTGADIISGNDALSITLSQAAEKVTLFLSDIAGGNRAIDLKIFIEGSSTPINFEHVITGVPVRGLLNLELKASDFGGFITKVEVSSVANSAFGTETFWLDNVKADIPGGIDPDIIRIGFEDLLNTGDADYEDVLFDLDINGKNVGDIEGGNDYLDGGAGNDTLYGEGGADTFILGLGADQAYGGKGADTFAVTLVDALVDTIHDFTASEGDKIDIAAVLDGYDPLADDIADFVSLVQVGSNVELQVNADGAGSDFTAAALIMGGTGGQDLATLIASGSLVVS
jgi:Ca2+-binding RTX toxin-like protein